MTLVSADSDTIAPSGGAIPDDTGGAGADPLGASSDDI